MDKYQTVYVVYPDSIRMGLNSINTPVAYFKYKEHAEKYAISLWEGYYIINEEVVLITPLVQ